MAPTAPSVAAAPVTRVTGTWQRHSSTVASDQALNGRRGYGRWGTPDGFPVLYLGRPTESVTIEAYRHLMDPVDSGMPLSALAPRILVTTDVSVADIVDLRAPAGRMQVGLTLSDLRSETSDREAYARCQRVAQLAHQLGRHGILAPAATKAGETLALFVDLLQAEERPVRSADDQLWSQLPSDPRTSASSRLRLVRDKEG